MLGLHWAIRRSCFHHTLNCQQRRSSTIRWQTWNRYLRWYRQWKITRRCILKKPSNFGNTPPMRHNYIHMKDSLNWTYHAPNQSNQFIVDTFGRIRGTEKQKRLVDAMSGEECDSKLQNANQALKSAFKRGMCHGQLPTGHCTPGTTDRDDAGSPTPTCTIDQWRDIAQRALLG